MSPARTTRIALSVGTALLLAQAHATDGAPARRRIEWRAVRNGVEYAALPMPDAPQERLHVVRIDPRTARLRAVMASAADGVPRTAGEWCDRSGLCAAINLGMYQKDYRSNVGHARARGHVNNPRWASSYKSALVFDRKREGIPHAALLDLDGPGGRARAAEYHVAIQNLRLIRAPGENVWARQSDRWSEAAVAMDGSGQILFLFCRSPRTMWELNRMLLAMPLDIRSAMHVEGGAEASLSIRAGGWKLDLNGGYDEGASATGGPAQWPIPNVIGVAR